MCHQPQNVFPLIKSNSFPDYFSAKIISIDKILAFLQAFELIKSCNFNVHDHEKRDLLLFGLVVMSLREPV